MITMLVSYTSLHVIKSVYYNGWLSCFAQIQFITSGTFDELHELEGLDLRGNQINAIGK